MRSACSFNSLVALAKQNCGRSILIAITLGLLSISAIAHPGAGIAVDRHGQVYFLDTGSGLWRIDTRGRLAHLDRTLFHWLALDEDNRFANTQLPSGARGEIIKVGSSPTVLLSSDYPIAVGDDGNLYYPSGEPGALRIMKMSPSGASSVVVTLPTTIKGEPLPHLGGIISGPERSLYYTEDSAIRRIDAQGQVSTVVSIQPLVHGPSIPAVDGHPYLRGVAVNDRGGIYVADSGDARVLTMAPGGNVRTLVQTQSPWAPTAVAVFNNTVYVLEFLHTVRDVRRDWLPRVRKIASNGKSSMVATLDNMPYAR
jgi:streptogramin lyase